MAALYKSIRYDRAVELEKELSEKVAELLQKAKDADSKEAMETDRAKELYKKRKTTVEPVFGIIHRARVQLWPSVFGALCIPAPRSCVKISSATGS